MTYLLDCRQANRGGAVTSGVLVEKPGLGTTYDLRKEAQVTVLLHGFNVNRSCGEAVLLRLARQIPAVGENGVLAVLWPGDHWIGPLSYPFEGRDADDSAAALASYIMKGVQSGTQLQFVTHSLGARVALETVKRLPRRRYRIGHVCVLAAAVDDFSLAIPDGYQDVVRRSHRVAVLASRRDMVLKWAYPAGDLLQRFLFLWNEDFGCALGYHGPRPGNIQPVPTEVHHEQIPDNRQAGHGDYFARSRQANAEQQSTVHFVNQVLSGNVDPFYPPVSGRWLLRRPSGVGEEPGASDVKWTGPHAWETLARGSWHD